MNPRPEQQRECLQHHSPCRLLSSTGKSTYRTSTDVESFINVWTFYKMMQYVAAFVSNFLDSKLCLGFTHDVVYCSTLFSFISVEYAFEWSRPCTDQFYWQYKSELFPVLDYYKYDTTTYHDNVFGCKYVLLTFHV